MKPFLIFLFLSIYCNSSYSDALIPLEHFIERDRYGALKISPDGQHIAATVIYEDNDILVILDAESFTIKSSFKMGPQEQVNWFEWATAKRLLISSSRYIPEYDFLIPTGKLFSTDIDGKKRRNIFGYSAGEKQTGTRLRREKADIGWPTVVNLLKDNPKEILITSHPFIGTDLITPKNYRLNIETGRKSKGIRHPISNRNADFMADHQGNIRIAYGQAIDGSFQIHHRFGSSQPWELLLESQLNGQRIFPRSLSKDGQSLYLLADHDKDRLGLYQMNLKDKHMDLLYRHQTVDIEQLIYTSDGTEILGVKTMPGKTERYFFDPKHPESRLLRSIAKAFHGQDVSIVSSSLDRKRMIVRVSSPTNPGDFYLYEKQTGLKFLVAAQRLLNPQQLSEKQPIELESRDGLKLNGYLTRPKSDQHDKPAPMVVLVHGGPHGAFVRDRWVYETQVQILASRGYSVLQMNFRGTGGYGSKFEQSGYGKWGRQMQDDITDATLWAINQKIADPDRICIMGGSYGAYSALMGTVREPDLYRCAIATAGVYDLSLMQKIGDIQRERSNQTYLDTAVGYIPSDLKERSPSYFANKIKASVFLIHGKQDQRTPFKHAQVMRAALRKSGNEPQWLTFDGEAHGIRNVNNQKLYYQQILDFLEKQIGDAG